MIPWATQALTQTLDITLDAWSVYEVPLHGENQPWSRHLVGFKREGWRGQVSSAVQAFDPVEGVAITKSGRVYLLNDYPGSDADARYCWGRWKAAHAVVTERDVTDEVFGEIVRAGAAAAQGVAP
jgi:hypothetical protein